MSVPYGASTLNRLLRVQLDFVKSSTEAYLTDGEKCGEPGQMPHEWGSIDSWRTLIDTMSIAVEMMEGVSHDAGLDDEGVKRFLRNLIKDKWLRLDAFADEVAEFASLASYDPETDTVTS